MNLRGIGADTLRFCGYGVFLSVAILSGCKQKEPTLFTKLTSEETSIHFNNINVENEQINIFTYEYLYNGAGVAVGDINHDGLPDLYFSSNNLENKLYLNKGNFEFEDITQHAGAGCKPGWKTGVSMVDINADGWLDLYVCRSADSNPQNRKNFLLINNHDLTFTEKASEYGLDDDSYSTQAAFFDYDRDGDLDAFLLNHSLLSISNSFNISMLNKKARYPYLGNKLLRNDKGHFTDVSESAGIYGPSSNYGLGIGVSDLNNDGWPDVYVSNDYVDNDKLYLNNHDGTFLDATDSLLTHVSQFSMGLDIADVNQDGLMDILTLDMLPEGNKRQKLLFGPDRYDLFQASVKNGFYYQYMRNMLQVNNGDGTFTEAGQLAGIANTDWSWSALVADYDNDGLQDLFVSNGYKRDFTNNDFLKYRADQQLKSAGGQKEKYTEMIKKIPSNKLPNYIFRNMGGLTFMNAVSEWGLSEPVLTNGAAYADLDNDGDLDLVMNNMDAEAGIYKNNSELLSKNSYLQVKLQGDGNNTMGIGAKVSVFTQGKIIAKEMYVVRGFQSSVEPVLHFGLGSNRVDSLIVEWPAGSVQKLGMVKSNQQITLAERNAKKVPGKTEATGIPAFFTEEKGVINFIHKENDFVDFKTQALLPRMYSRQGPALAKGDVDGDGLDDIYVGGAKGQSGELFIQDRSGKFNRKPQPSFTGGIGSEDTDALFFDADNDHDLDLYVVSGGYEYETNDKLLMDHLYRNDGKGNFVLANDALPEIFSSGACVRTGDVDMDGDMDLFVGGRLIPGRYPESPDSYLLVNDGKGRFTDQTDAMAPVLKGRGMVTDAAWVDLNKDRKPDLVLVGEWMPVTFLVNENGKLIDRSSSYLKEPSAGWWNCIAVSDIDKDGDDDLIVGNNGMNTQMKPSEKEPVTMIFGDFDKNGSIDPIISYFIQGESFPYPNRDELTDQIPSFKKRFTDYDSYSKATISTILTREELKNSATLTANRFTTSLLINQGNGSFTFGSLPQQAQVAPVFSIAVMDVNADGNPDLIMAGNLSHARVRMGKLAGNYGFVFPGDGKGNFTYLSQVRSGLHVRNDVMHIAVVNKIVVFGINDGPLKTYKLK